MNTKRIKRLNMHSDLSFVGTEHECLRTNRVGKLIFTDLHNDLLEGGAYPRFLLKNNDGEFYTSAVEKLSEPSKLWQKLMTIVEDNIRDDIIYPLCEMLSDNIEKFHNCPGSDGGHHWHKEGLLEHTLGVAENAVLLCDRYSFLNRTALIFGAITHDFGKLKDYEWNEKNDTGIIKDNRWLITHAPEALMIIKPYLDKHKISEEYQNYLLSIVGQHMGNEMMSVTEMNTPEAIFLNFADHMDAIAEPIRKAKLDFNSNSGWSKDFVGGTNKKLYFYSKHK